MMFGWIFLVIILFYLWNNDGQHCSTRNSDRAGSQSALEILRERFARGEMSSEEFNERKRVLE
jgi:putative membrane protein